MAQARSPILLPVLLLFFLAAVGFAIWRYLETRPPAALALIPVSFAQLPGWDGNDPRSALAAFRRSCAVFAATPPAQPMGGSGYAGSAGNWADVCRAMPVPGVAAQSARIYFEKWFVPVEIEMGDDSNALFTGYYEPEIHASRVRHGAYETPVYGEPDDLMKIDLGRFRNDLANVRITGRIDGRFFVPYFSRAEIDARGLPQASVLLYADDPIAVFFLHIQGSGRARLDHGVVVRLSYAGQNGRPYTSIGRTLINEGAIDRDRMSMQAIRAWLESHPKDARAAMESDASYVFFKEAPLGDPALGSPGSEGVPLTPIASIAVDAKVHPLGAPFFIAATAPDADPARPDLLFDRLVIAQDTGGAIKGTARADIFWGFGSAAESIAGRMKATGRFFVLLPKPVATRLPLHVSAS